MSRHLVSGIWHREVAPGVDTVQGTLDLAVLAAEREVDVPRPRLEQIGDFALDPDILKKRVAVKHPAEVRDELGNRNEM
jgi:hypothetical protein